MRRLAALSLLLFSLPVFSQQRTEYRGFWVDTFNSALNSHTAVVNIVNNARAAKANAIFAQVRRRGDSFYQNSLEPLPQGITFTPSNFDALQDLITEAHAAGLEVHAFVIVGAVSDNNPTINPLLNPNHVFNKHGGYDSVAKTIVPGPENWLTRTLLPDNASITFQGHRFGATFWIDLGHPEAAQYTLDVLMNIVRNYDIDGIHLDRIRYPEFSATGQTPSNGTNIGYNTTNVDRFNARYGLPTSNSPLPSDAAWKQWRRDQVTNFVRRLYLNAVAVKPQLKMSASLIAFGDGPTTEAGWASAEAYWRVYQDWRSWTEEGIIDIAMPMAYKREHTSSERAMFDHWSEWLKNHQYRRAGLVGIGAYLNSVEGTLRQTRRALGPSAAGNSALGVSLYSMATPNAAVTSNPYSIPPNQNTPVRTFAEFASGLTTGKSVNGAVAYEDPVTNPQAIFADTAAIPVLTWKVAPSTGHLMGFARRADQTIIDAGDVTITNLITAPIRTTVTDGKGFFGGVDLVPGLWFAGATLQGVTSYSCVAMVSAGRVTASDASWSTRPSISMPTDQAVSNDTGFCSSVVDTGAPAILDACDPSRFTISGTRSDGQQLRAPFPVGTTTINWTAADGVTSTALGTQRITVKDTEPPKITAPANLVVTADGATCSASADAGQPVASDNCSVVVSAARSDGKPLSAAYPLGTTTITWTATDPASLTATSTQTVTVVDRTAPTISGVSVDRNLLWPANHKMVKVSVSYSAADACSLPVHSVLSVTSNEPIDGLGDGDEAPDWEIVDANTVRLRAERSGTGSGRTYTITITATDAAGNVSQESVNVVVPHDHND